MSNTTWFEMKEQRKTNRKNRGFREGHRRRSQGYAAVIEKRSGEVVASAKDGCFGRLKDLNRDLYEDWAQGTRGAE